MEYAKTFWLAFWSGLAAPGMLFAAETPRIPRLAAPCASARDAMRGDWMTIGADFAHVIAREKTNRQ